MKKRNLTDNIRRVPMSDIRKTYFIRLIGRIAILLLCVILGILCPGEFEILRGVNFFHKFSVLHLLCIVWVIWELRVLLYPERFWEMTNDALKCSNCKDKLCIQYCQKLR